MTLRFRNYSVYCPNLLESLFLYQEIFLSKVYNFETDLDSPFIIDCGSHVGFSLLYFKNKYPKCRIISFEADPDTFQVLRNNIKRNNIKGIELINKAVTNRSGKIAFYRANKWFSWSWGSSTNKNKFLNTKFYTEAKVDSTRLSKYIHQDTDFLKIDIEGAESEVIYEIEDKLKFVKNIFVEFHRSDSQNKSLEIIKILKKNGFIVTLSKRTLLNSFINIFTSREEPYRLDINGSRN